MRRSLFAQASFLRLKGDIGESSPRDAGRGRFCHNKEADTCYDRTKTADGLFYNEVRDEINGRRNGR